MMMEWYRPVRTCPLRVWQHPGPDRLTRQGNRLQLGWQPSCV